MTTLPPHWRDAVRAFKQRFLSEALRAHGGHRTRTAAALGIDRTYLARLLRELGLTDQRGRAGLGSFVALTFLYVVFWAGVYIGAHVTLATLAGR